MNPGHRPSASALGYALPARWAGFFYAQLFQDFPHIEPEIFTVLIEGNRAITEQKMTIIRPDCTQVVLPFNTNHFTFEGDLIKTLRVMGSPA